MDFLELEVLDEPELVDDGVLVDDPPSDLPEPEVELAPDLLESPAPESFAGTLLEPLRLSVR